MLNRFVWYSAYITELSEPGTLQKNKNTAQIQTLLDYIVSKHSSFDWN